MIIQWQRSNDNGKGQITFKNKMLSYRLCDYSDASITIRETITNTGDGRDAVAIAASKSNKPLIFKSCAPSSNCISEINNTRVYNA